MMELLSLRPLWDQAPHSAFTDLTRHKGRWLCTFREGESHALTVGKVRVLASDDGETWTSVGLLAVDGIDLRDPKLCPGPGGTLDLVMGASPIVDGQSVGRSTWMVRSADGLSWGAPSPVTPEGDWLWRVDRHRGTSYGVSYRLPRRRHWTVHLMASRDGLWYRDRAELAVGGLPNEATVRFRGNQAIALVRREARTRLAWIGTAEPPYRQWSWHRTRERVGGPNFLVLPDGTMVAATRIWRDKQPRVAVCTLTDKSLTPVIELPSGGDCGYPGMVWHRGVLWLSYYSSHEGSSRIYLARVRVRPLPESPTRR